MERKRLNWCAGQARHTSLFCAAPKAQRTTYTLEIFNMTPHPDLSTCSFKRIFGVRVNIATQCELPYNGKKKAQLVCGMSTYAPDIHLHPR